MIRLADVHGRIFYVFIYIQLSLSHPGCIVTYMAFMVDSSQVGGARVRVADADVGSLGDAELVGWMAELGREHIEWFSRGGPTDLDNLALLCERCHHLIHDDNWQLHKHNGRHALRPPAQPPPRQRAPAQEACERNTILRT